MKFMQYKFHLNFIWQFCLCRHCINVIQWHNYLASEPTFKPQGEIIPMMNHPFQHQIYFLYAKIILDSYKFQRMQFIDNLLPGEHFVEVLIHAFTRIICFALCKVLKNIHIVRKEQRKLLLCHSKNWISVGNDLGVTQGRHSV